MLTFFTIPKPFKGHIAVIQRNALRSWKLLDPHVEVIVLGEEEGTAEVCHELGLRYEPEIERSEFGTPLLNHAFDRAQQLAQHDWLCYSNCDIILMNDLLQAFEGVRAWRGEFLMLGQRWDMDINQPLDFETPAWNDRLREQTLRQGRQRGSICIDYFVFRRGQCAGLPSFAVGRPCWDQWLIWWMRHRHLPVVDASAMVIAVHQNHDYRHLPEGPQSVTTGKEVSRNRSFVASWRHLNTIDDASHVLRAGHVRRTYRHWGAQLRREFDHTRNRMLVATAPARSRLGLRKSKVASLSGD